MKKVLFLFTFMLCAGLVSAQSADAKKSCAKKCAKTCASKKASADSETKVASAEAYAEIAAEAAASDESIERKVCDMSGKVSYYKKSTCEVSGATKMTEVQYDADSKAFVNVSPKDVMADKEAKVVKTSSEKKACCAGKDKKACASKKSKA